MKFRKILKWELFAGLALIITVNFVLINLLINAVFRNAMDNELNSRLEIIGGILAERLDATAYMLDKQDRMSPFYPDTMRILDEVKKSWQTEITLLNREGKPGISTAQSYSLIERLPSGPVAGYSITYFDSGRPVKNYIYRHEKDGKLLGYILFELTGKPLAFFREIGRIQAYVFAWMLLVALVLAFAFSTLITRRIDYTVSEMEKIASGMLDVRIKTRWFDEFSWLQDRINGLVADLRTLSESREKEIQIVAMGLAHEIKNPAAAILTLAELAELAERGSADEKVKKSLNEIRKEVLRLNSITEKFIHFARDREPAREPVASSRLADLLKQGFEQIEADFTAI
ncbi:MAG TPA: histidine kinase dimerization/phospho-acceptor domain-containing protein, partial [Candidatus Goldiibacteriota bacterium]|nr:histidine kinase dimerization/phospho-acceptor domain-containing protein [Candidatus Goldiibacteriota bacterium]